MNFWFLWPQKYDRRLLMFFSTCYKWSSHVRHENQLGANERKFIQFISATIFSAANVILGKL